MPRHALTGLGEALIAEAARQLACPDGFPSSSEGYGPLRLGSVGPMTHSTGSQSVGQVDRAGIAAQNQAAAAQEGGQKKKPMASTSTERAAPSLASTTACARCSSPGSDRHPARRRSGMRLFARASGNLSPPGRRIGLVAPAGAGLDERRRAGGACARNGLGVRRCAGRSRRLRNRQDRGLCHGSLPK